MQDMIVENIEIEISGASIIIAEGSGNDLISVIEGASSLASVIF